MTRPVVPSLLLVLLCLATPGRPGLTLQVSANREMRAVESARLVREAEELIQQRKWVEAAGVLRKAAEAGVDDSALWDRAGWAHLTVGQAAPAREAFEQAARTTPPGETRSGGLLIAAYALNDRAELLKLVRATVSAEVADRAEPVLTRGLAAKQRTLEWNFGLGYLYARVLGNSPRALPFIEAVAEEDPKRADAWLLLAEVNQALNRGPQEDAAAIEYLKLAPETPDAYRLRAQRCFTHQQFDAAVEEYTEGIEKHPEAAELYFGLARVQDRTGKPKEAEATYRKLIDHATAKKLDNLRAAARAQLANYQLRTGNLAGAEPYFREVAARPEAAASVSTTLGALLALQKKWPDAAAALDAAAERDEKLRGKADPSVRSELLLLRLRAGLLRLAGGQKEPARLAFEAALGYRGEGRSGPELEARSLLVWLEGKSAGLGGLAYGKGDERWAGFPWRPKPEEGEMDVRRRGSPTAGAWRTLLAELSKSSPDCWPVRYSLARLLAGEGKTTEAVALLQEVVKSRPDWWAPYYALADHQSREGLHDAAQASLQRVLALAPECQAARAALSLLKSRPKK